MDPVPLIAGIAGFLLMWAGWRNKHPLHAIRLALQGQDPNTAPPLTQPLVSLPSAGPAGAVPSEGLPGSPGADSDARTDPPGFVPGPNNYVVPILPGEAQQGSGVY